LLSGAKGGLMRGEGNRRDAFQKGEIPMKRTTALAFLAATLISMTAARAHAQAGIVQARIPFDFIVQNSTLPAGAYRISYASQNGILIRSLDGRFHVLTTTSGADGLPPGEGKVVFKQYGNRYFLHEVLCSGQDMNVAIPTSNLEKRMRIEEAQLARTQTVAALQAGSK
jgi:hypothetical protein